MISLLGAIGANQQTLNIPQLQYSAILPELILACGAVLLLLASSLSTRRFSARFSAGWTVVLGTAALVASAWDWSRIVNHGTKSTFAGAMAFDHFAVFFEVIISVALILSAMIASDWLTARKMNGPEFFVLMIMSAVGAQIMAAATDLIVIFLGLEVLSIALYVLVGLDRTRAQSREAAVKYFVLGGFSSAIFLYGIALVYGATGSTNLNVIATYLSSNALLDYGLVLGGTGLLLVGFAFKIAAVPFHQWTPDVYQGAPTPVTGYMAAAAKAGAFAALLRVFGSSLYSLKLDWQPMILAVTVLTLLVGSIVACVQSNVKRMLAYSSISHAGYILLGLQAATDDGISGSMFYLLAYTFMVIGSFAIVSVVGGQDDSRKGLEAFRGLSKRNPVLALAFTILLLAQAGVPLTSGFLAKFYVIAAQIENKEYATALFAMIVAAIATFFYLRIVFAMYSSDSKDEAVTPAASATGGAVVAGPDYVVMPMATQLALAIALLFTIGMGILPPGQHHGDWIINTIKFAQTSATDFFSS